jgi:hypothetical protein
MCLRINDVLLLLDYDKICNYFHDQQVKASDIRKKSSRDCLIRLRFLQVYFCLSGFETQKMSHI